MDGDNFTTISPMTANTVVMISNERATAVQIDLPTIRHFRRCRRSGRRSPDPKQHEEESQVTQPALAVGVALRRGLPGHLKGDLHARPLRRARDIDTAIAHGVW
jgi:hypothetical protein